MAQAHNRQRGATALLLFTVLCVHADAQKRKDVPLAPPPAKVLAAKKVFLVNGGGNDLAYDALYSAVKDWGRFEIVDGSAGADIIMEIRYVVIRAAIVDPQLVLNILDAGTKDVLWSTVEHRRLARVSKNRDKETIKAAQKLVDNLKVRFGTE